MLCVDDYLASVPGWARDGTDDRYAEALTHFGLETGRNPSQNCPAGHHGESEDLNVVVYDAGVMCYSQHGFFPRQRLIELASLQAAAEEISLADLARREVGRFVAEDQLRSLLRHAIIARLGWTGARLDSALQSLFTWALRVNASDADWNLRLDAIFRNRYPKRAHEFWSDAGIVHSRHDVSSELEALGRGSVYSYKVRLLAPREKPGPGLAVKLAPTLAGLVSDKRGGGIKATTSAWIDRFLAGETQAIRRSSLLIVECVDRPVPALHSGWRLPKKPNDIPRFIDVPTPAAPAGVDPDVVARFLDDLKHTFAFANDESYGRCVAYLIQPLMVPLAPGQFPGYCFVGPTRCGKSALTVPTPRLLYRHNAGNPVFEGRFPEGDYEMAVQLDAHRGVAYAVFDEAIDLSDRQLKVLDNLITSESLTSRKMKGGYVKRPNYVTFALSAIVRPLPPETAGRVLEIQLTESRPDQIQKFFDRWRGKGPQILRGFYDALAALENPRRGDFVAERRPGFGILKRVLREAFKIDVEFDIRVDDDEVLDLVCSAHFQNLGSERSGGWRRISFGTLAQFYRNEHGKGTIRRTTLEGKIHTAVGCQSTRRHPVYKDNGYRWEKRPLFRHRDPRRMRR